MAKGIHKEKDHQQRGESGKIRVREQTEQPSVYDSLANPVVFRTRCGIVNIFYILIKRCRAADGPEQRGKNSGQFHTSHNLFFGHELR